jgi:ankyrin repeat protein
MFFRRGTHRLFALVERLDEEGLREALKIRADRVTAPEECEPDSGRTCIHVAVYRKQLPFVQLIAEQFPQLLEARDSSKFTPLHLSCAADEPRLDIVSYLLEVSPPSLLLRGAKHSETPLHAAARGGNVALVELLLANGTQEMLMHKSRVRRVSASVRFVVSLSHSLSERSCSEATHPFTPHRPRDTPPSSSYSLTGGQAHSSLKTARDVRLEE